MKQTEIFHMLSDETRLRAMVLMADQGELCVCELVHGLELSQPKISRHMAALRDAGLVASSRRAQWVFYRINPDLSDWQQQIVNAAVAGAKSEAIINVDAKRLQQMQNRPGQAA